MENELWAFIQSSNNLYMSSNLGRIKSLARDKARILKPFHSRRYLVVDICVEGKRKCQYVHKLVWEAFNGPVPEGYEINHIDENPENNQLTNLNLMTRKENSNWGTRNQRIAKAHFNGKKAKPVIQYDLNGNVIKYWVSASEVERQLGFNGNNITACCRGEQLSSYGFIWKYDIISPSS